MKSKLQEIAQKQKLKMPEYIVSGAAKNYMASVTFDGRTFSSKKTFAKKKQAEQDAAHIAMYELGHISNPPDGYVGRANGPKAGKSASTVNSFKCQRKLWLEDKFQDVIGDEKGRTLSL